MKTIVTYPIAGNITRTPAVFEGDSGSTIIHGLSVHSMSSDIWASA